MIEDQNMIQILNDNFRKTFVGGRIVLTTGINSKSDDKVETILEEVKTFNNFTKDNDPYQEHETSLRFARIYPKQALVVPASRKAKLSVAADFGSISFEGDKILWKIDYYDKSLRFASNNPENPKETIRVMTIILADEY